MIKNTTIVRISFPNMEIFTCYKLIKMALLLPDFLLPTYLRKFLSKIKNLTICEVLNFCIKVSCYYLIISTRLPKLFPKQVAFIEVISFS